MFPVELDQRLLGRLRGGGEHDVLKRLELLDDGPLDHDDAARHVFRRFARSDLRDRFEVTELHDRPGRVGKAEEKHAGTRRSQEPRACASRPVPRWQPGA